MVLSRSFLVLVLSLAPGSAYGEEAAASRWPALSGPEAWPAVLDAVSLDERNRPRSDALAIEDAYRTALAHWASASFRASVEALAELETRFEGKEPTQCLEWAESNTFESLAAVAPEALLPALAFHVEVWLEHVRQRRYWNALQTRWRLETWLDLYVAPERPGAGTRAAALLVHWVELLIASKYPEKSEELLDRALGYAPDLPEALHLRALVAERDWRYGEALPFLERLLELRPDDGHARVRYGLNLARTARPEAAVRALGSVARSDGADWIRILAYQELARLAAAGEGSETAVGVVQEALGFFPRSEQLAVQLAHLLRRREGRPSPLAGEILNAFLDDTGIAPRMRYESEPRKIGDLRRRLFAQVEERQAHLLAALDEITRHDAPRARSSSCRNKLRTLR